MLEEKINDPPKRRDTRKEEYTISSTSKTGRKFARKAQRVEATYD